MKFSVDPIVESASDLKKLAQRIADDGTTFLKSSLGSIPLLSSIQPRVEEPDFGSDERHYFLVPFRPAPENYALYTLRVLPDGIGPENDLPKRRIFHLPGEGSRPALEELLRNQLSGKTLAEIGDDTPLADRLDQVADDIDRSSTLVTGGLLLIGGAVAFANPVAGAVIAAKAIIPSLGSKVSTRAFGYVGDKLRKFQGDRSESKARKEAEKEVNRLKPELQTNPLLALLEEAIAISDEMHDPALDPKNFPDDLDEARACSLAAEAIWSCYQPVVSSEIPLAEARLHQADADWLRSLEGRLVDRNIG